MEGGRRGRTKRKEEGRTGGRRVTRQGSPPPLLCCLASFPSSSHLPSTRFSGRQQPAPCDPCFPARSLLMGP